MATKKVLVEINVEQKGNSIPKTTKEVDKLAAATKRLEHELSEEAKTIAQVNLQTSQAKKANTSLAKSQLDTANATEGLNKNLNEMKTTAGLSGAIVTEFGRTISDLPYGIRGVGNNLSQLGTLFGLFSVNVAKSGRTMKQGFAEIFQQFKGIIGIMTAFQVVIALFQSQWFQKWAEGLFSVNTALKTNIELMKAASEIAGSSIGTFKVYISLLNDEATEQSEKLEIIKKLNEEYPEFNANLYNNTERTKEQIEAEKDYILLLKQRARAEAAVQKFQEAQGKIIDLESQRDLKTAPIQEEIEKIRELGAFTALSTNEVNAIIKDGYTTREQITNQAIRLKSNEINQIEKNSEKEIKAAEEVSKSYEKYFDASGILSGSKVSGNSIKKGFRSRLLDLKTLSEKFRQESLKGEVKTDEELIREKAEFSKRDLAIKVNNFIATEKLRLKEFLLTKGLSKKQKDSAKKSSDESIDKAKEDSKIVLANIEAVYDAEINLLTRKEGEKARAESEARDRAEASKGIERGSEGVNISSELFDAQSARLQNEIDYQKGLLDATEQGTLERSIAEQQYFDSKQNLRDLDIEREIYEVNEKKRINSEYISWVSGLSGILSSIAGDNEAIQKASLVAEKGAAIASVVVGASKSIGLRVSSNAALLPPAQLADAAFMAKDIARTKISAGIAIAGITAAGISQASNIGGGGGSSSTGSSQTVQPPDFNIVGSTGVNQLADAIGSTETPIVKAVVVASEVTTQQALDRNTRTSAEL